MRALSIQVQPNRTAGLDVDRLTQAFTAVAAMSDLVAHHHFNAGDDNGPYLNFTFGTADAARLWSVIQQRVYEDPGLRVHMQLASMAMCSSETGWHDYALLYHFDPTVAIDPLEPKK